MLRIEGAAREIEALLTVIELSSDLAEAEPPGAAAAPRAAARRRRLESAIAALPAHIAPHLEALLHLVRAAPAPLARATHCPACHMRFAAMLESRLRDRSVFFFCPHCRRPLYRLGEPGDAREPPGTPRRPTARRRSG
jgi:predicted  nucleic acid-binding Zn-ribbon protein